MHFRILCLLNIIFLTSYVLCQDERKKLCAVNYESCLKIEKILNPPSKIKCVRASDGVDILKKLESRECDFARVNVEELQLAADFKIPLNVVAQIKEGDYDYEPTVIIKTELTEGLNKMKLEDTLKGKKYCSQGFNTINWSKRVVRFFENYLLSNVTHQKENKDLNVIERDLDKLNSFFGKSCRPGRWVDDVTYDNELKERYSNLKCDDDVIECLKHGGDFAYLDLDLLKKIDKTKYKYLCLDGSVQDTGANPVCVMFRQPCGAIVAINDKKSSYDIQRIIGDLQNNTDFKKTINLKTETLKKLSEFEKTPKEFLKDRIPLNAVTNKANAIRWCVCSDIEYDKCNWLSKAISNLGIEPEVTCIKEDSIYDCYKQVNTSNVDIVSATANEAVIGQEEYNLRQFAYFNGKPNEKTSVVIIINDKRIEDYKKHPMEYYQNKKICLPEYKSLAWYAFNESMPELNIDNLNKSCAIGSANVDYGGDNDTDRFCKFDDCSIDYCVDTVNPISLQRCYETAGILVTETKYLEEFDKPSPYSVVCKNGTITKSYKHDEGCPLVVTVPKIILTRKSQSQDKMYKLLFASLQKHFSPGSEYGIMNAFGVFRNNKNVLLSDTGINYKFQEPDKYYQNYKDVVMKSTSIIADEYDGNGDGLDPKYYILIILSVFLIIGVMLFMAYYLVVKKGYLKINKIT